MERLTERDGFGNADIISVDSEDLQLNLDFDGLNKVTDALNKLAGYEDLEEQGLLLKLPCKVGDYIWDNDYGKPCSYEVTGFSFGNLNQGDLEDETAFDQVLVYYTNSNGSITGNFAVSEIGKTVFLTQIEAEEALKKASQETGTTQKEPAGKFDGSWYLNGTKVFN